jgi:hypothetical protein
MDDKVITKIGFLQVFAYFRILRVLLIFCRIQKVPVAKNQNVQLCIIHASAELFSRKYGFQCNPFLQKWQQPNKRYISSRNIISKRRTRIQGTQSNIVEPGRRSPSGTSRRATAATTPARRRGSPRRRPASRRPPERPPRSRPTSRSSRWGRVACQRKAPASGEAAGGAGG